MAIKFLNSTELTSTLTVSNGQIVLNGTGRIQGIDTVSSNTDAANKLYVDNAVAGVPVGDITSVTAGTGLSGGGSSGAITITNAAPNIVQTTVSGNAGSATVLQTARTIAGVSFNGSANISLNNNAITNGAGYTSSTGTVTSIATTNGITGGTITSTGTIQLDSTVVRTTGTQTVAGSKTFTSDVRAPNFRLTSDERLKENAINLKSKPINTEWKSFTMKGSPEDYRVGVLAQELEVHNPEFVVTDEEGYKSVKYIDLLVAKIAELEARLEKAGI